MATKFAQLKHRVGSAYANWSVTNRVDRLNTWINRRDASDDEHETYDHTETVNDYYDLCHEFMEYGWSDSLHFAPLTPGESLEEAIKRHQRLMIQKLQLQEGMRVVDVGCGVGGPMRRVIREGKVTVVGVNNNEYQLAQAKNKNIEAGLDEQAAYVKCNFMDMSELEAESFDAGYAIESTCHAPDKLGAFKQIFRLLKPGALLWGQEMCLTDAFDASSASHQLIKRQLMEGIALNEIASFDEVNRTIEAAGFEVLEASNLDVKEGPSVPWYSPMQSRYGTVGNFFRRTPLGRKLVLRTIQVAELMRIFPKQSHNVIQFMDRTAAAYVDGGKTGLFTPLYCYLARKPSN
ncbi:MAG: methyltransferase domain-containing protein [Gammaproteobacteria bacterium]|nr:methyltransferase domain-containing protein [Gammaproteobacteria bacterium]